MPSLSGVLFVIIFIFIPFTSTQNNLKKLPTEILCKCSGKSGVSAENSCHRILPETNEFYCRTNCTCKKTVMKLSDFDQTELHIFGCISDRDCAPRQRPLLCHENYNLGHRIKSKCCRDSDFCNADLQLELEKVEGNNSQAPFWIYFGTAMAIVLVVFLLAVLFWMIRYQVPIWRRRKLIIENLEEKIPLSILSEENPTKFEEEIDPFLQDVTISCGSGSGAPLLMKRTIARKIHLFERVGQGRFGEVYRGTLLGDNVAVKIFNARDEFFWSREVEIYQTTMLHHLNVLGFVAADNRDAGVCTQLWLITDFHPIGSLYDFLTNSTINLKEMLKITGSIASGLNHLHSQISTSLCSKPEMAHRDIKSKNILVKSDLTCCIGDLGLAVRFFRNERRIDLPRDSEKGGTIRYMPPELLDDSLNFEDFESFKQGDVYSLALVFWEILRRTKIDQESSDFDEFQLPFFDAVSPDPSVEELRICVCEAKRRPLISSRWNQNPAMNLMQNLMEECWVENANSRLPVLRIKMRIDEIYGSINLESKSGVKIDAEFNGEILDGK